MKVIGKSGAGYLIAASESEIANLFGHYSSEDAFKAELDRQLGRNGYHRGDLIGLEIRPNVAFNQLLWLRRRDREFDELVKKLRETADAIQDHRPLFDSIIGDKEKTA